MKKKRSADDFDPIADQVLEPHPLEKVFNLEPGSTDGFAKTIVDAPMDRSGVPITSPVLDPQTGRSMERTPGAVSDEQLEREERAEDLTIDKHIEEVRVEAMEAFRRIAGQADASDPRFTARLGEVAAQYLNIALNSTSERVDAKYKRAKVRLAKNKVEGPKTVNQNLIVADRNQLLKLLEDEQRLPIDAKVTKVEEDK